MRALWEERADRLCEPAALSCGKPTVCRRFAEASRSGQGERRARFEKKRQVVRTGGNNCDLAERCAVCARQSGKLHRRVGFRRGDIRYGPKMNAAGNGNARASEHAREVGIGI